MTHHPRHARPSLRRPAWVAIVAALWLAGGIAPGALASPGIAANAGEGKHRCPCGMDCGTVCCCRHKAPAKPKPGKPPARTPAKAGPCMGMAPCGGALPPGVSAVALSVEKADCPAIVAFVPGFSSSMLVPPGSDRSEGLAGSPPDEPPERRIDA
ncbi:hypothetical protein TA3x_002258 [Tundrisphaera sp. TA3]|uniref:hypothetical protein n=1 Tax=Tundrisphaera sp. TA3 TaxID=3435775 RepID=UPI003EB7B4C2